MYTQESTAGQTHFRLSGCLIYHLSILRSITTVRNIIAKRSIAHTVDAILDGISRKVSDAPSTNETGNRKIAIIY